MAGCMSRWCRLLCCLFSHRSLIRRLFVVYPPPAYFESPAKEAPISMICIILVKVHMFWNEIFSLLCLIKSKRNVNKIGDEIDDLNLEIMGLVACSGVTSWWLRGTVRGWRSLVFQLEKCSPEVLVLFLKNSNPRVFVSLYNNSIML